MMRAKQHGCHHSHNGDKAHGCCSNSGRYLSASMTPELLRSRNVSQRSASRLQSWSAALSLPSLSPVFGPLRTALSNASVNGLLCNDLCKASGLVRSGHGEVSPVATPNAGCHCLQKTRPDGTSWSWTRRSGSNSFAQLPQPSDAALQSVETPHIQAAPSAPVQPIRERFFPADGIVTAKPADAGGATNEPPETTLVSVTGFVSAT